MEDTLGERQTKRPLRPQPQQLLLPHLHSRSPSDAASAAAGLVAGVAAGQPVAAVRLVLAVAPAVVAVAAAGTCSKQARKVTCRSAPSKRSRHQSALSTEVVKYWVQVLSDFLYWAY